MRWRDRVGLAGRLAAAAPLRSGALALGLSVLGVLPLAVTGAFAVVSSRVERRVAGAPVLLLAEGDPRAAAWSALALSPAAPTALRLSAQDLVLDGAFGDVLPVRVGRTAQGAPLVGVGAGWLEAWGLALAQGRSAALPGEVVAGAGAARRLGLVVGDGLQPDPDGVVTLETPPPPTLSVVGVLVASDLPEHDALLTTLETTWLLDGALHGEPEALHMHADRGDQPVSAVVVRPRDARARDRVLAAADAHAGVQGVQPKALLDAWTGALGGWARGLGPWVALVAGALAVQLAALLQLTLRTRAQELTLVRQLGGPKRLVQSLVLVELGLLLAAAVVLVAATGGLSWWAWGGPW